MTGYVIRAIGFANGAPCPHADKWLEAFDHNAYNGQGFGSFTVDASKAKHFASRPDAIAFWRRTSTVRPLRQDGRPNRPLTALTVQIEPLP